MSRSRRVIVGLLGLALVAVIIALPRITRYLGRAAGARVIGGTYLGTRDVVLQDTPSSCGAAALAMILRQYGIPVALPRVEAQVAKPDSDASFHDLVRVAAAYGLRATGWRMSSRQLSSAALPAIAHVPDHFVVVDSVVARYVYLRDPGLGAMRMRDDRFDAWWTHDVLVFARPPGGALRDPRPSNGRYSFPSAILRSTRPARRAGTHTASVATTATTAAALASAVRSSASPP